MEFIVALVVIILAASFYLIRKIFFYWKDLGVPQFPITFPHGNIKNLGKHFHLSQFLIDYYQKTKDIGAPYSGIYTFSRPVLMIRDLEVVKTILVKDFNVFPNRGNYFNEKDDPVSAHLFNIENDPWRHLRHKLSPTFTSGKLKMMFGTICEVSDKLISEIDKEVKETGQLEVKDKMARFTTDVIGTIAFGIDCNSLGDKDAKFYEMGTRVFSTPSSFFKRVMRNSFRGLSKKLHIKALPDEISDFYLGITRETVEYREKNPDVNRQDFINLLVQMKKAGEVTVEQIAAQSFVFFLAGYETSSSTITYCMYELSINKEIQEKARKSVEEAIKKHGSLSYDAVSSMDYLEQCVDETLRKYPVVSLLNRTAIRDYQIPDTKLVLPKGQAIWIPVHAIHW
jgi:cytochrome P450 family 6